ncbi:MerR family transcriptional regulator [Vallitalea maricola]|uniref:MerR family transcriptional regulator n=1 Tax=Vallitalea maricola TaxID=3074433 RepID=A0ACB5UDI6_9FIRM|nr:MerR family transcriptional regulator [Vallitalea sp. AN17-2]
MTVKEVSKIAGISVRTLHYYDEIGLLKPKIITESGYRIYSDAELETLFQILFFKELDFKLVKIKEIMSNPSFNKAEALKQHKKLLLEKKKRLNNMISSIDRTLKRGFDKKMMNLFSMENYEKYKEEAIEKYGDTAVDSYKKTSKYSKKKWEEIMNEANTIYSNLAENMDKDVSDPYIQQLIGQWKNHITTYYYDCNMEIFRGLGQLYVNDERFTKNIDKTKQGLAKYMKEAMDYYCDNYQG